MKKTTIPPIAEKQQRKNAIEFSKWLVVSGMFNSDLTYDEMYDLWYESEDAPEVDGAGYSEEDNYIVSINVDVNCTSYKAEIDITYQELVEKLGNPVLTGDKWLDKSQADWWIEGYVDGEKVCATIYDYKNFRSVKDITDWHIGGRDENAIKLIQTIFPNNKITK